jgi:DNA-binding HxlR family transcriptional regulator
MPLPSDYSAQTCSIARSLEVLGERWTLLIVRDAFFGVRRFGDFVGHLDIPRAVLTARLKTLVEEGVLTRVPGESGRDEYELTDKGTKLWPVVRDLMAWGDEFYAPVGPLRILRHSADDGALDSHGRCATCGAIVPAAETTIEPGPGFGHGDRRDDAVSRVIARPRRLLEPVRV